MSNISLDEEEDDIADEEEEDQLLLLQLYRYTRKRKARCYEHDIVKKRKQYGAFYHLVPDLKKDDSKFQEYFRMTYQQFSSLLELIKDDITAVNAARETIPPEERLAICLRFLATGETFRSLAFHFRVGVQTVARIVEEVCETMWKHLSTRVMAMPQTEGEWKAISEEFNEKWNFPHCIGCIDGKHIVMKAPSNSGTLYYNYKGSFSIVLMALVDANYKFSFIDVGAYGSQSDGGIFKNCNLSKALKDGRLGIPQPEFIPGAENLGKFPFVMLGDEAFPLLINLMRPYPGKFCDEAKTIFNFRLSRARRIVENAFGILASRWRVFHSKIGVSPQFCESIVKATCCLHNMLQQQANPVQIARLLQDGVAHAPRGMVNVQKVGFRGAKEADMVRGKFKTYFAEKDPLDWQLQYIRRGENQ